MAAGKGSASRVCNISPRHYLPLNSTRLETQYHDLYEVQKIRRAMPITRIMRLHISVRYQPEVGSASASTGLTGVLV